MQRFNRLARGRLHGIGHADESGRGLSASIAANITVWPAWRSSSARLRNSARVNSKLFEVAQISDRDRAAINNSCNAFAGDRLELLHGRQGDVVARARRQQSPRPADARSRSRGSRQGAKASSRRYCPGGATVTRRGLPSVSVPVLSTTSVVICSRTSSASAFLNSTPASAPAARADHDRHRRRQPERAWARDDQHRDRIHERIRQSRLRAKQRPRNEGDNCDDDDNRHEPCGHGIGEPLNGSARSLGLADHSNNLRQQRIRTDTLSLHRRTSRFD